MALAIAPDSFPSLEQREGVLLLIEGDSLDQRGVEREAFVAPPTLLDNRVNDLECIAPGVVLDCPEEAEPADCEADRPAIELSELVFCHLGICPGKWCVLKMGIKSRTEYQSRTLAEHQGKTSVLDLSGLECRGAEREDSKSSKKKLIFNDLQRHLHPFRPVKIRLVARIHANGMPGVWKTNWKLKESRPSLSPKVFKAACCRRLNPRAGRWRDHRDFARADAPTVNGGIRTDSRGGQIDTIERHL
jgi:hypothetical protein